MNLRNCLAAALKALGLLVLTVEIICYFNGDIIVSAVDTWSEILWRGFVDYIDYSVSPVLN